MHNEKPLLKYCSQSFKRGFSPGGVLDNPENS